MPSLFFRARRKSWGVSVVRVSTAQASARASSLREHSQNHPHDRRDRIDTCGFAENPDEHDARQDNQHGPAIGCGLSSPCSSSIRSSPSRLQRVQAHLQILLQLAIREIDVVRPELWVLKDCHIRARG